MGFLQHLAPESLASEEIQAVLKTFYVERQEPGIWRIVGALLLSRKDGFKKLAAWFYECPEVSTKITLLTTLALSSDREVSNRSLKHCNILIRSQELRGLLS